MASVVTWLYGVAGAGGLVVAEPFSGGGCYFFFSDLAVGLMPLALLYTLGRNQPSRTAAWLSVPGLAIWWYLHDRGAGRNT